MSHIYRKLDLSIIVYGDSVLVTSYGKRHGSIVWSFGLL